jgi:hypothetical protein
MKIFTLEHHPVSYFADFVLYPVAIVAGMAVLLLHVSVDDWMLLPAAVAGFGAWSLVEYALHRYVLHGLQPFKRWHEEHHQRPFALIGTSTLASLVLFVALVYLPLAFVFSHWLALAATLGVISGYLFYVTVHHASHHWKARPGSWLQARKQAHARHHMVGAHGWYGVTTSFWDRVFFTDRS